MSGDDSILAAAKALAIAVAMHLFDSPEYQRAAQRPFRMDTRAATGAGTAVDLVVALVVGGLMAAFLLPIAIDEIIGVDTSSWTNGAGALWDILPVIIILSIFLYFVGVALTKSNM